MKKCNKCFIIKDLEDFHKDRRIKSDKKGKCKKVVDM